MSAAVDTVVPVARGQVRRWQTLAFLVLDGPNKVDGIAGLSWKALVLTGPVRTEIANFPDRWVEHVSTVVEP